MIDALALSTQSTSRIIRNTGSTKISDQQLSFYVHVFRKLEEVPADFGPAYVSVGNFDGVHRAHAHVLGEIVSRARADGGKAVAVTFEPHPARILKPESGLKLLTPTPEKLRWLQGTGIDAVLVLPFGRDLSLMTPRQFAERILQERDCTPAKCTRASISALATRQPGM